MKKKKVKVTMSEVDMSLCVPGLNTNLIRPYYDPHCIGFSCIHKYIAESAYFITGNKKIYDSIKKSNSCFEIEVQLKTYGLLDLHKFLDMKGDKK
jgi:hypothetical protein